MRKIFSFHTLQTLALLTAMLTTLATAAQADTIRLKNGSVIKGKVTSFADEQFVVLLDSGSGRSLSKATIYIADVAKIDFEGTTEAPGESSTAANKAATDGTRDNNSSSVIEESAPPKTNAKETSTPPVDPRLKNTNPKNRKEVKTPDPVATDPPVTKEPEVKTAEKTGVTGEEPPVAESTVRKPLANARVVNIDVSAKRDWTSSGVIVKRGDRVRVTATGTITLDADGATSGPEGIDTAPPDAQKFMADKTTGALIAVISADNDDFIFIGRAAEFTAKRDGLLFLSVNEGSPKDNAGSFKVVLEVQAARPGARQ